jgi:hypothetical protein
LPNNRARRPLRAWLNDRSHQLQRYQWRLGDANHRHLQRHEAAQHHRLHSRLHIDNDATAMSVFRQCATDGSHFYLTDDRATPQTTFQQIGQSNCD